MKEFLKTTLIGGIVFLIPISVCVLVLGKAFGVMKRLAAPLAEWVPVDTVAGVAKANIVAVLVLVLICFGAGLLSRSRLAAGLVDRLDSGLQAIPGYSFLKGLTGGWTGKDEGLVPVLARFDDNWQVAFLMDTLPDGRAVLFLPGAPDPWSGSVVVMDRERVQPLDRSMAATVRHLKALGRGSAELLSRGDGERGAQD